jgi:hypothetical protein
MTMKRSWEADFLHSLASHGRIMGMRVGRLAVPAARHGNPRTNRLDRQIAATDRQIDRLVYDLYGLTDEEIALVEGA